MAGAKKIIIIFLIISLLLNGFLALKNATLESEKSDHEILGKEIKSFITSVGQNCKATEKDPLNLAKCVRSLRSRHERIPVDEGGYRNAVPTNEERGYLIVQINDLKSYESDKFTLLHNHEIVNVGCVIPGNITKDETCKMFFDNYCERGDVLEIQYDGNRMHLKNC